MATYRNLLLWQGDDFEQVLSIDNFPYPLTDCQIRAQIRDNYTDKTLLAEFTCTASNATQVKLTLSRVYAAAVPFTCKPADIPATPIDTMTIRELPRGCHVWDLQITSPLPDNQTTTEIWGYVVVPAEITLDIPITPPPIGDPYLTVSQGDARYARTGSGAAPIRVAFGYGDATPKLIAAVTGVVTGASITIENPLNDGVTLSIGTSGSPNLLMDASQNLPTVAAEYKTRPNQKFPSATSIYLSIGLPGGANTGSGYVELEVESI